MRKTASSSHVLLVVVLLVAVGVWRTSAQAAASFKCSGSTRTCKSLVGYISPNTTTLSHIQALFQVKTLRSLLGVNNLPQGTPPSHTVAANSTVKVPIPCRCSNATGLSNRLPVYTIVKDDGLSHIANQVFGGLVTYQQIQAANGIKDANLIIVGHQLWIPLPCSCDDVDGDKVVHYAHLVAPGSSLEQIADNFGTTSATLMSVNGIKDPKDLIAGQVLDVPLTACKSSVIPKSFDYPLLVPRGTYVDTAHNCVMCKCTSANNFTSSMCGSQLLSCFSLFLLLFSTTHFSFLIFHPKPLWDNNRNSEGVYCLKLMQALPVFTFANQAGLDMLETTFVALQDITLEKIFDEQGRKILFAELPQIMQQGFVCLQGGVCMSSMGRPVSYERAVAWKVFNDSEDAQCMCFMFVNWSFV